MLEDKKVSYYYIRTISTDPMDTQYDGLYTLEKDWLSTFEALISADIDAYVYDAVRWKDHQPFVMHITSATFDELPEDVKDGLVDVPYPIAYILRVSVTDERGKREIYIFIPKN